MGLVGFLKFAFKCFDLLDWYASIRAIENNSSSEMRNVVAYWILFSLVSLFELAFVKLTVWLPFWPFMKLMATCFLVLPHFNGASCVYECLVRPCLSVDLRGAIKYFIKPKEEKSHNAKVFLPVAERYVEENGSEALEKLLDRKSKHTKPDIGMEEIKTMTNTEEKETAGAIQSKYEEPNVGKVDARAVEQPEKRPVAATKLSKVEEPGVGKENANTGQLKDKNPAVATEQVKCVEPNFAQNEKKTVAAVEIKEKTVAAAGGENKAVEITDSEKVQREWACALCQVTISSEKGLDSHLQGRKHKAKFKRLIASKQVNKNNGSSSSAASSAPENRTKKQEHNVQVNRTNEQCREKVDNNSGGTTQTIFWCSLCDVKLQSESALASHLGGKKHLSKTQQDINSGGTTQTIFWCSLCNVKLQSESALASHLGGKKHLSKTQQDNNSGGTTQTKFWCSLCATLHRKSEKKKGPERKRSNFQMGLVGFLKFAFKCFDLLAWYSNPIHLYASIRAIENNSSSEMRNVVAYWILFSLVSLFELALVKLTDWLPFWPFMKLMATCFLVLPHFNGASYVYECLVRPCLSVDPRGAIKYFIKPMEEKSHNPKVFLAVAERYVEENGSEALEKLLDRKSKHTKPDIGMEQIKAMTNSEKKETAAAIRSKYEEPNVGKVDARAVEQPEKRPVAATKLSKVAERYVEENGSEALEKLLDRKSKHTKPDIGMEEIKTMTNTEKETAAAIRSKYEEPNVGKVDARAVEQPEKRPVAATKLSKVEEPGVGKENANTGQLKDKNPAVATEQVKCVEPNLAQNEKKTVAAVEIKEKRVAAAGGENKAVEITDSEKVQREWACALCQVTIPSEKGLDSHLQGRKHKAKFRRLIASKQVNKNNGSSSSAASSVPENRTKKQGHNVQVNQTNEQCREKKVDNNSGGTTQTIFWCSLCDVKLQSESTLASHLGGKKHLSKTEQDNNSGGTTQTIFRCSLCDATLQSESTLASHLRGKKHLSKTQQDNNSGGTTQTKFWCSLCDATLYSESSLASHLGGKKHLSKTQQDNNSGGTTQTIFWYASIRAIENNSYSDMRNVVAYWILFSLVSLFELAFVKPIDWLLFWPYMKLMATCFLVLPHFNGASYVYECLLRPCLSVDLRGAIKYFIKPKEEKSNIAEVFLAVAERYVEENGSEALEKLLDRKSKHTTPDIGMEEIKAMANTEEKETAAAIRSKYKEHNVGKVDAGAVEQPEKRPIAATTLSKVEEPSVGKENANTGQLKDENPAVATEQVKCVEPNLAQNEKKTVAAGEIKEKTVGAAGGENKAVEITDSEKVQREWACSLCQVTIPCEKNLDSHLQGRKHKAKFKKNKNKNKNKGSSSSAASLEPKIRTKKQEQNVQSKVILDDWKRLYSNTKTNFREVAIKGFWDMYDPEGYSLWFCDYKYNDENTVSFVTLNKVSGFLQRMDLARKFAFGKMLIIGSDPPFKKVDISDEDQKERVNQMIEDQDPFEGESESSLASHLGGKKSLSKTQQHIINTLGGGPLFGLGCPLYASIRAIENNSNSKMRNLVAYWILFSLVSVFELAFVKLTDWLPFWPYLKLMAMCLLVLPDFNGASYVYECLLRPCLSVDPRTAMKYLIKPKEDKALNAENFLAVAERYVQENGSEALEKLLDRKSNHTKPDIGVEEIKSMTNTEERDTAAAPQFKYEEPDVVKVDARAVALPEKSPVAATKLSKVKEPHVAKENANAGELKDESPAAVATEQVASPLNFRYFCIFGALFFRSTSILVKCVEPNLAQNEKKTVAAGEIKAKTVATAGGESKAVEIIDSEKVQREWTCALCQVTTTSEKILDSHLQGRRHKARELKASKQVNKSEGSSSLFQSKHTKPDIGVEEIKEMTNTEEKETAAAIQFKYEEPDVVKVDARAVALPEKSPVAATKLSKVKEPHVAKGNANAGELKDESPAVATEQVKCVEPNLAHNEKKSVAAGEIKKKTVATAGGESKAVEITDPEKVKRVWTCALCQVTTIGEKMLEYHLQGRRHKAQELKASKQVNESEGSSSLFQSKHTKPDIGVEEIKEMTITEEKETPAAIQSKCEEPNVGKVDARVVGLPEESPVAATKLFKYEEPDVVKVDARAEALPEKSPVAATKLSKVKDPHVAKENSNAGELKDESSAVATEQVKCVEPNLAHNEKETVAAGEIKKKTVATAGGESKAVEITDPEKVKRVWTCALCQVTTIGEKMLEYHLQGRRHKAQELKASKKVNESEGSSSLFQSKHTKPDIGVEEIKEMTITEEKETPAAIQSKCEEPNVGKVDARVVGLPEESPVAATKLVRLKINHFFFQSKVKEPHVAKENANVGEWKGENPAVATGDVPASPPNFCHLEVPSQILDPNTAFIHGHIDDPKHSHEICYVVSKGSKISNHTIRPQHDSLLLQVKCVEPNLAQNEKNTVAAEEIKEKTLAAAGGENKAVKITDSEKVQREWTCALCQVTATSEKILDSHLQGRKHKAQELKASKQVNKNTDGEINHLQGRRYGSIRAIENNSYLEMRNVVAYWILFSLVSLFELAFVKLIDWPPVWPYIKLLAMCLLVLPDFNGASYVYECLLRPCLSVDPRAAIKYFIKPKEDKSLDAESFQAVVDRYVQENGSEALEKLLDRKSKHTKPDIGVEVMKAMTYTEEKETAAAIQSKYEEPNVGKVDARAVELPEKSPVAATKLSKVSEPHVDKENANAGELKDESPAVATEQVNCVEPNLAQNEKKAVATRGQLKGKNPAVATEQVKRVVPNLAQNEKKTVGTGEIKGETVAAAGGEKKAVEITDSEKVQREWTCALCQVTTTCEEDLNSHLQGREHMDKCEELKASKQVNKNPGSSSSAASPEPKEILFVDRPNQYKIKNPEDKVQVSRTNEQYGEKKVYNTGGGMDPFKFRCTICDVKLISDIDVASHLGGKRHLSNTQQLVFGSLGEGFY
ncbi:hypothetical protein RHGRI_032416 [Rhododendron griersonianum]|uniref:HVA22-like protein n=1 Tax=Rhododendron griersonianum TaxID=479676 RepID=A0AAV6IBQ0_9ERIC|nr:hypothetical protein RHGRI_032416 [Rhododendron griersonianum]